MQAGATDYIKKPWGPAELQERIAIIVGARELEREGYITKSAKSGEKWGELPVPEVFLEAPP
jgi:DNA-binding response OmpR family regulator